jgi:predicted RecB family endonuclease
MATVLPPEFPADHSGAEHLVYRKLRDETPAEWYALHSVGLVGHERKAWAEIDFVVITDRAVICLEVKGGTITVEGNRWYINGNKLSHSPFDQAGGAPERWGAT